ncbi:MAG: hypothetical protein A7316_04750 [Candidatus Altiarchaeales archaeon WOR_SM1_86-2]|nr:MAG: hypothetical protein A7316_04750 [Candidatus Altiarchaeales archaeon WOR_SM1_86-2]
MEKIIKIAEKYGAEECEVFYSSTKSHSFFVVGEEIKTNEFDSDSGFGVRILKDNRIGFSYFTDKNKAEEAVKTAVEVSKFSGEIDGFEFSGDKKFQNVDGIYDKKIVNLGAEDAKNLIDGLISGVKCCAEPIESDLGFETSEIKIMNSGGLEACGKYTRISCTALAGYKDSSAHESYASCSLDINAEKIGKKAGLLAKQMYKPKKVKSGRVNVIFNQSALNDLLSAMFYPATDGSKTRRGLSFFCGREGKAIGDNILSIYDDPLYPGGMGSSSFDAEGLKTFRKPIIEKGVLKNFLYDLKNAALAGVKSTGNGSRGDYSSPVSVSPSNVVVGPGNIPDLISECKNGIYLHSALGWHTANSLVGDFSVSTDVGFKIENGEIKGGIKGMIADNFFEMIKKTGVEKRQKRHFDLVSPKIEFYDVNVVGN